MARGRRWQRKSPNQRRGLASAIYSFGFSRVVSQRLQLESTKLDNCEAIAEEKDTFSDQLSNRPKNFRNEEKTCIEHKEEITVYKSIVMLTLPINYYFNSYKTIVEVSRFWSRKLFAYFQRIES
jgi:hypothetical protein